MTNEQWTARDYLCHHGIIGQKWGVRRFQNPDGSLTSEGKKRYSTSSNYQQILKDTKTYNIDSWGKTPETNVLYLTGLSGSGKSTVAENLKSNKTDVIHLDFYFEKGDLSETAKHQSESFNKFMKAQRIPYDNLTNGKLKDRSKEKWALIDRVAKAIDDYGKAQYRDGKRVVCEGVQIADQTLRPDEMKSFYKGKPMAIMKTGALRSTFRGNQRDGINILDIPTEYQRFKNQRMWSQNLRDLPRYART